MYFLPVPQRVFRYSMVQMHETDRIRIGQKSFIPLDCDEKSYRLRDDATVAREVRISHEEICQMLTKGEASIDYDFYKPGRQKLRLEFGDMEFQDFAKNKRKVARFREQLILLYEAEADQRGKKLSFSAPLQDYLDKWTKEIAKQENGGKSLRTNGKEKFEVAPSVKSFKRYYDAYRSYGRDIRALVPRNDGPGKRLYLICPEGLRIAHEEARRYMSRTKPGQEKVYQDYEVKVALLNRDRPANAQIHLFSRTKIFTIIKSLDAFETMAGRDGEKIAIEHFGRNRGHYNEQRPGARVEIDEWKVDMMTFLTTTGFWAFLPEEVRAKVENTRIWVVAVIDVSTRYILALKVTKAPCAAAALAALRMTMTEKSHVSAYVGAQTKWLGFTLPQSAFMDNGSALNDQEVRHAFMRLNIEKGSPPAGQPRRRPFIETLFGSLAHLITPYFDGRTFGSVAEKGDYDPGAHTTLTAEELEKLLIFMVCDIYHNKPHASLGGASPHNAWITATENYGIKFPSADTMRAVFGVRLKRKISKDGITFMGIPYNSDALMAERMRHGQKDFDIIVDPENLRQISVRQGDSIFTVENSVGLADGVTMVEWMETFRGEREKFREQNQANLMTMYEGLNRLRAVGEAATLRAGLGHRIPNADDIDRWDREVFQTWQVTNADNGVPELSTEIAFPDDPLRGGEIGVLPMSIDEMRIIAAQTKTVSAPVTVEKSLNGDISSLDVDLEY
jgi:putative transposase